MSSLSSLATCNEKTKEKNNVTTSQKAKNFRKVLSPTTNFLVGDYGLRMAERWDDMPSMSSEVGEI